MGWGAQQWLKFTKEATYGVRNPSPGGSDVIWVRLYQANPFTMRPVPQRQVIRSADASNRRRQVVAARKVYSGTLSTLLYPTQSSYWMTAATTLVSNDLASYTVDYYDSTRVQGYLGCKIQSCTLSSNAQTDYVPLSINLMGQRLDTDLTTLTQPTDGNFPTEVPYEHAESAGQMIVGASTLTKYSAVTVQLNNVLVGTWDEQAYITNCYYCGRDVDFTIRAQYLSDDFREAFEAQSALTCSLKWNRTSPSSSLTLNCLTKTYTGAITDEIPLDGPAYQTLNFQTFYDTGSSTDLVVTVA